MSFYVGFRNATSRRKVRTALMLSTFVLLWGCHSKTNQSVESVNTRVSDATISLPKNSGITEVFTTRSESLVVKTGESTPVDKFHRSLYSWQPGQRPKLIMGGHFLEAIRLSDDDFAATWYSESNETSPVEFATLNAFGLTSPRLMLPPSGPTGWGGCEGDTRYVVCIGNLPTMTVDDRNYDEMGFSAVLIIDVKQRQTSWFPVKHQTYFHFNPARKLVYVGDPTAPSMNSPMKSFDLAGHEQRAAQVWTVFLSPSGHFAESLQEDGSESWEVYDSSSKNLLLAFNCQKPECKIGDRVEDHHWNPVFDGQVVALNSGGAYGKGGACDVYQSSTARLVKRVPCGGLPVLDWSRDGRELITIQYTEGKFHREAVNQ